MFRPGRNVRFRRPKVQGISLLELVLVFFILSILLGITAVSLKSSVQQEGPRAMAYNVQSDLRAARSEATRSGKLVAVCFPSNNKTNSFSRNALVRKGAQRGHIFKILSYDKAYDGAVFLGKWGGAVRTSVRVPLGWETSTADEMCLYFRPDGTAFSNDIPALDGSYPLVIGGHFNSSGGGPDGTISGVTNPHTVWVSGSGNITLSENSVPVGVLPATGTEPLVASLDLSSEPSPRSPKIEDIKFLPEGIPGSDTVGLGQNYVNIHPDQKESTKIEYGIATMLISASDVDGGPLYFDLQAIASSGEKGNFTVSNETGAMDYVYDKKADKGIWQALVSWRPPPGAPEDTVYELQVTVRDEQGNTDFTASGAGLLPRIASLPPARMVLQTSDGMLYLSNIEASSTIRITKVGEPEQEPFFSPDGTRIYSKHWTPAGGLELRVRNADGSGLKVLRAFPPSLVDDPDDLQSIKFDPTYTYAAYQFNKRNETYPYKVPVKIDEDDDDWYWDMQSRSTNKSGVFSLEVIHLNSGTPPITIAEEAEGAFYWDATSPQTLRYHKIDRFREPEDLYPASVSGADYARGYRRHLPSPGFSSNPGGTRLEGFPPITNPAGPGPGISSDGLVFNPPRPDWYLQIVGNDLNLDDIGPKSPLTVTSGHLVGQPAWSADGRYAAYVEPGGKVVVKQVLNADYTEIANPPTTYSHTAGNASVAKLSPEGRWVFFIRNGELYRAINATGATPVRLAENLGKSIVSFAVSQ